MDPVRWFEGVADGSSSTLFLIVMIALFVDSLAVIGVLLPGDLILLVPAAAVGSSGALTVMAAGITGTLLGYVISYTVGHRAGPAIRASWVGQRVGEHRWGQAERLLRGPGGRALVLVQFMPVLNYLVPMLAGTLRVPMPRFLRLIGLGAIIYSGFYVTLGVLAGAAGQAIGQSTGRLVALVMVAIVAGGLGMTVLARAAARMSAEDKRAEEDKRTGESKREPGDPGPVDATPPDVAHCPSCSTATAFSTGTGSRCP